MKTGRSWIAIVWLTLLALLMAGDRTPAQNTPPHYAGGSPGAPVTIEVFSDYQCPACRSFYLETVRPVIGEYSRGNRVAVIYRDFPLQMHTHAREATRYALAARRIGHDLWLRVSDALYAEQEVWSQDGKIEPVVARVLSTEQMTRVRKLLQDPSIEEEIKKEIAHGEKKDIRSTPTFFISVGGREQRVVGGVSYPILKDYLDRVLK